MSCACKGIRVCLICEKEKKELHRPGTDSENVEYAYCYLCNRAWKNENPYEIAQNHPNHSGEESLTVDGIMLIPDFVTEAEEQNVTKEIDNIPWIPSQSGRRKQDFGPKVNFKKKKVKIGNFQGFPHFVSFLAKRFEEIPLLRDFVPVELCNLEYVPERGSSIDRHLDDSWLWGERLVTINLLSNTVMTLSPVSESPPCSSIFVPLYRRSLLVLHAEARIRWYHAIHRKHVDSRRLAMTFRELSKEFLPGGEEEEMGKLLLSCAIYKNTDFYRIS
ncbi:alpha-ketoglutarate-dependent dioxygenase alkB homolog 4-like [Centruroides sculpturatus]|uniref:alpha-ketoglutarate-dependent dioxygenase alkB homolog 4-like n=1 Tax=Centruroides sculpturatus TaxID=218467 RepID=UPI000C6D2CB8|nr:alpha-ketoglutarate-dependent dioxygenase alkB homolog 4-like [Centruroides sculpturatus]